MIPMYLELFHFFFHPCPCPRYYYYEYVPWCEMQDQDVSIAIIMRTLFAFSTIRASRLSAPGHPEPCWSKTSRRSRWYDSYRFIAFDDDALCHCQHTTRYCTAGPGPSRGRPLPPLHQFHLARVLTIATIATSHMVHGFILSSVPTPFSFRTYFCLLAHTIPIVSRNMALFLFFRSYYYIIIFSRILSYI